MKFTPYSASKIGLYENCNRRFKYRYVDKIKKPFQQSVAMTKGHIVHFLLEYHELPDKEKLQKMKLDAEIMDAKFYSKELVKECIHIYRKFINTEAGKRLLGLKKLQAEGTCALTRKLKPCGFRDNGVMYRGVIDRIAVDVDKDIVYIIDWKTGADKSKGHWKQNPKQLLSYAAWYFATFPVDTVIVVYAFVEHDNAITSHVIHRDKLPQLNKTLITDIIDIEKEVEWVKNETGLCNYCEYQGECIEEG